MEQYLKALFSNRPFDETNFFLIAGPCVVESEALCLEVAEKVLGICQELQIPYIFKASYRKANRTSANSFTGIGDTKGLEILAKVRATYNIAVTTDIHSAAEAALAAEFVDVLQIPAFLCRQTDLLLAAAATGKIVNVKKGQFLSGESMKFAVEKITGAGNHRVGLIDRGNMYGYQDLVVDYRNIPIMQKIGVPVIMDCTHSLQQPNQPAGITGGNPEMIETIAKAAIAVGADGLFIETHPDPTCALSDGANMLKLDLLSPLLHKLQRIKKAVN